MKRNEEVLTYTGTTSPYTKRIELTKRDRHELCEPRSGSLSLGKARVGAPPGAGFPPFPSGPFSQLIRALYEQGAGLHFMALVEQGHI